MISTNRIKREDYFYSVPDHLFNFVGRGQVPEFVQQKFPGQLPDVYYIQHHRCHAANAFFLSPFEKAAILTADWRGELETITKGFGDDLKIEILDTQWMPHSIGMFYATFTQILGYKPDNDEWKVMAMSAEDVSSEIFEQQLQQTFTLLPDGRFELDQRYYTGAHLDQPNLYSEDLLKLLGTTSINLSGSNTDYFWQCAVAKAMQQTVEKIIWHILDDLYEKNPSLSPRFVWWFFHE